MLTAGRVLLTVAALSTLIGPVGADLNGTHVFNEAWPPHARFHSVTGLVVLVGLSVVALWLIWRRSLEPGVAMAVAALVPVLVGSSFFITLLIPGAGVEDHPGELARIAGMPFNVLVAAGFSLLAVLGYVLYRLGESRRAPAHD
jgi:hypothetical protein